MMLLNREGFSEQVCLEEYYYLLGFMGFGIFILERQKNKSLSLKLASDAISEVTD